MSDSTRYRVRSSLGRGGMGEVFLADDTQLGRTVAIKFLTERLENDPEARERLRREARSAAALDHPYICKVYEIAAVDGRTGIVMEHVEGETLLATLTRGALATRRALAIAGEMAEALDTAHQRHVVHRDLKPSNVMLASQGHVKVMDFGLAKALDADARRDDAETVGPTTEPGTRIGTPAYMAPEQLLGQPADPRSDIFAFGLVLYEMLAGIHPFQRTSRSDMVAAIVRETPAPIDQYRPELPASARTLLDRLLAKEPNRRPAAFAEVVRALGDVGAELAAVASAAALPPIAARQAAETPAPSRTTYVGRAAERAEGRRLLDQAIAGRGTAILVGGEPGVGKTRFTEELAAEARARGCLTLVGHCYDTEGTPPFIPFVEMLERSAKIVPREALRAALGDAAPEVAQIAPELRRIFPDLPAPIELPPEQQRRYLFNAYQQFTERSTRAMPLVAVLEDLHWADEPTLLLMQHLVRQMAALPFLIVGTYRDVELDVGRPFAKILEALVRERLVSRVTLRRLSEADVEAMLEALGGAAVPPTLAGVVFRETEGNPFFVEEVFQHLKEEGRLFDADGAWRTDLDIETLQVPEGVRLVIGRRLERVSDDARRALTVGAVIGRRFDLSILEAAADVDGEALLDALEEAERAKLIGSRASGREAQFAFTHELIRQTLGGSLSLPRRQRLHLRIAEAIARVHGGSTGAPVSALAHHYYQAGAAADRATAAAYLERAAEQALAALAFEEALTAYDRALSAHDPADRRLTAALTAGRGGALRSLGHIDDSIEALFAAVELYEAVDDGSGVGETVTTLVSLLGWRARVPEAVDLLERALRRVDDDAVLRCRLITYLALLRGTVVDRRAFAEFDAARALAEQVGDPILRAFVDGVASTNHWYWMQWREAVEVGRRAVEPLMRSGRLWECADVLWEVAACAEGIGADAAAAVREAEDVAARIGHDSARWGAQWVEAQRLARAGDLDAAEVLAADTLALAESRGIPWVSGSYRQRAMLHWIRGRWTEAMADTERGRARELAGTFIDGASTGGMFAMKAYTGDPDALDFFERHRRLLPETGQPNSIGAWTALAYMVEGLAYLGARAEAADLYPLVCEVTDTGVRHPGLGTIPFQATAGIAAACGRQWEVAERHFATALEQVAAAGDRIGQPEVRRWSAWMRLERDAPGDRERARTLLDEAMAMYRAIGMPRHLELVEALASRLG